MRFLHHTGNNGSNGHKVAPINPSSVRIAFKAALVESGIKKGATVHTLRHSYVMHMLEAGINQRIIQAYLGHQPPRTTAVIRHTLLDTI